MVYITEWQDEHECAYTVDWFNIVVIIVIIIIIYTDCDV